MAFKAHVVTLKADDQGSGFGASLKKVRGGHASLVFSLRPAVAEQLGFTDGHRLAVLVGDGDDHGLIRLRVDAAGSALVKRRETGDGVKRGGVYFSITLGHLPQFVDRSEGKRWCQFEQVDEVDHTGAVVPWVEVVLPSWAEETGEKRGRVSAPISLAATKPQPAPHRNLVSSLAGDPPPGRSALDQKRAGK